MNQMKIDTLSLLAKLPITPHQLIDVILGSWDSLLKSRIGEEGLEIPKDIDLSPQVIGTFLEKIVAHRLANTFNGTWKAGVGDEKDIVYVPDQQFSIEMKTSTSKSSIYGNRSYAQPSTGTGKKDKKGYFIGINYDAPKGEFTGKIRRISIGWLEHTDWIAQAAPTGQQSSLTSDAKKYKMIPIFIDTGDDNHLLSKSSDPALPDLINGGSLPEKQILSKKESLLHKEVEDNLGYIIGTKKVIADDAQFPDSLF